MPTRRERLRDLLLAHPDGVSLDDLAILMESTRGAVLDDLRHLQRSLRHRREELQVRPPACIPCGFAFRPEEPKAPSKCPACRSRSLRPPVFRVVEG